jgi:quercetin dioxygenase-like cupin family protein
MSESEGAYPTEERVTIAETPDLRVRLLALGEGQCVPWHYHNSITDNFFCMEGPMQVTTRNPDEVHVLEPGGICAVKPGTPHLVTGVDDRPCKFIVVQGVGAYDFVPVAD